MMQGLLISTVLLWAFLVCHVLVTFAIIRRVNTHFSPKEGLNIGERAPDFTASTLLGEAVTLRQLIKGFSDTTFIFISSTCPPCRDSLPQYEDVYRRANQDGRGLVLVSISTADETEHLVDEFALQAPIIVAPLESISLMRDYKVPGTPFYCQIDAQGRVKSAGSPQMHITEWASFVNSLPELDAYSEKGGNLSSGAVLPSSS